MEQRLERDDIRLIVICAGLTVLSLLVGTHFFYDAFPEATIDFRITRDEAKVRAASFLEHRGVDLADYRHAALFDYDNTAKTFMERERGIEGASELIGDPVRLWRWNNRWFAELQKEEYRVDYTTAGQLVGFSHLIEEDATGASLTAGAARRLAEQFLKQTIGVDPTQLDFVEAESTQRPNRVDHAFTWKLRDFDVSDATYRYRVRIHGDLVGGYDEFLKVPESWQRQYAQLRAGNQTTQLIATLFSLALWIGLLVRLAKGIRADDIKWRTALIFGAIGAALTLLSQLNNLPVTLYGFDTTDSFSSFVTQMVLLAVAVAVSSGVGVAVLVAGAEPEYRRAYGGHISLSEQFLPDGLSTKRFLLGSIIGLTMTAVFVAYQTLFYLVADHFGAWSPADIPYSEMVNTHFPWIVVLLIGFMPAVTEEFTSRAFAIPFLQRLVRYRWLAIILAALVWGFAHAGYPQQPFWIRGVEVGLAGIAVGYVMIRWGLLPALVWHYTIDALYTALILLRSSNSYFVASAAVSVGIMLIPLLIAIGLYWRRRYFIDPISLLNREDAQAVKPAARTELADMSPEAQILSSSSAPPLFHPVRPMRLGIAALLVLIGLVAFLLPTPDWKPTPQFAISSEAARLRATTHLGISGVATDSFRTVVTQRQLWDSDAVTYRHEIGGAAASVQLYNDAHLATAVWRVRLFQPEEKEEWLVDIESNSGKVYAVQHRLAEEAPGADVGEQQARRVAEQHLRDHAIEPQRLTLMESSSEQLPARRDHLFVWEAAEGDARNLGQARFRAEATIAGDKPASLTRFVKLPEEWLRARDEGSTWRTVLLAIPVAVGLTLGLHLIWFLVRRIRDGDVAWSLPVKMGLLAMVLFALQTANGWPTFFAGYTTEISTTMFVVQQSIGLLIGGLFIACAVAGVTGVAGAMHPALARQLSWASLTPQWRDAALLSSLAVAGSLAWRRWHEVSQALWPDVVVPPMPSIPAVDVYVPALHGVISAVTRALFNPLGAALAAYYATRVLPHPAWAILALILFSASGTAAESWTLASFAYEWGQFMLSTIVLILAILFLYRDNVAAYLLTGFLIGGLRAALRLLDQPAFALHGWILLGVCAAVLLGAWIVSFRAPKTTSPF